MITRRESLRYLGLGGQAALTLYPNVFSQPAQKKPNFILIFIDDMGWPALSCYGAKQIKTQNIDRLAKERINFTDAYVTPQCTPFCAPIPQENPYYDPARLLNHISKNQNLPR